MGKLNQVVAVVAAKKKLATEAITNAYHAIQKAELFNGISRTYTPRDDEGERFPSESKTAQASVTAILESVTGPLTEMFDTVLTQDVANTLANSNVGDIAPGVPVTYLLFLEKQLTDLTTFVSKLPVLDPAEQWHWDDSANCYASAPSESVKSKKIPKAFVKYEATKEHPAQVEMFTEDVVVGNWKTIKFSGALKAADKAAMLDRVRQLHEAVVKAREAANSADVAEQHIGKRILDFVFKGE
jgi:hypothetical protein